MTRVIRSYVETLLVETLLWYLLAPRWRRRCEHRHLYTLGPVIYILLAPSSERLGLPRSNIVERRGLGSKRHFCCRSAKLCGQSKSTR
jgi:hypothetical protein